MSAAVAAIDLDAVGVEVTGEPYRVTRENIAAFAAATNDTTPACVAGDLAPPVYALNPVLWNMVAAKKLAYPDFGFHGEHEIEFLQALRPGMTVVPCSRVIGIHARSTGVAISVRVDSHEAEQGLVNVQHFVSFVSGATVAEDRGHPAPRYPLPAGVADTVPFAERRYAMDADQTRRYADASNDHDAYTLDENVARSMGFPTLLVHGMCTFAFAARAIVECACDGAPQRLRRLAVRLSRPVFLYPDQHIETRIWRRPPDRRASDTGQAAIEQFVYQSRDRDDAVVLTNGLAEVATQ